MKNSNNSFSDTDKKHGEAALWSRFLASGSIDDYLAFSRFRETSGSKKPGPDSKD